MSERRRITIMTLIMIIACMGTATTVIAILYSSEIDANRNRLRVSAQSQARLIEAVSRHEQSESESTEAVGPSKRLLEQSLSQIQDAHDSYEGFGETGELTLARREDDSIVFLLRHRLGSVENPDPVSFRSELAEPMRRALSGLSGTTIGLDYRGETVLAAYEPVDVLNLGLVAKINLSEIRRGYWKVSLIAFLATLVLTLFGTLLFRRVSFPVIRQLRLDSENLKREVEDRKMLETALIEREKEINAFFNSSEAGLAIIDADLKFVRLNRALAKIHGVPLAEHTGKSIRDVLPDFSPKLVPSLKKVLESGKPISNVEVSGPARGHSGGLRYWTVDYFPLLDPGGTVIAVGGVTLDITEKKEAESALRKWEAVFQHAGWGVVIAHPETRKILAMNPAFARMHGYTVEEAQDLHLSDLISEEDAAQLPLRTQLIDVSGREVFESVHIRKDGTRFPVLADVMVIRDEVGKILYRAANYQDITERKQAVNALRRSEMLLLRAEELAHMGHWSIKVEDASLEVSDETNRILGYESEESDLSLREIIDRIHPDDSESTQKVVSEAISNGVGCEFELRMIRSNGDCRHAYFRAEVEKDEGGKVVTFYGVLQDITEAKRHEAERLDLERQMLRAQKLESLGMLAGGIAHDFNNILMTILGNADLALQDLAPHAPSRGSIAAIETAARRAAELSGQMLAYSGKGQFVIERLDLGEFVEEMGHLLDVSKSKSAILKYDFADNLPLIEGDATQIRQVIMNLIINASEAIGGKSGVISISTGAMECDRDYLEQTNIAAIAGLESELDDGLYVFLEVADTGCGMDRETMEKIFDPFFSTKPSGRGLGMAAVLGIVRGHKGTIRIYSETGKGTTFKILFPASGSTKETEADAGLSGQTDEWRGEGTVLLVDDEETILTVTTRLLERLGFQVITAEDGRVAIEKFREHRDEIVCVLLDMTMPHVDGKEAFREMRRIQDDVRVILCSGYNEQDATQFFVGKGLSGFLQKPYRASDLKDKLREMLSS